MKQKIMITLIALISISIAAYSLTQMEENNPPNPTWGYDITWDDSNCNCTNPEASLSWIVYHYENGTWVYVDGASNLNVDPALGIYHVTSDEALADCQDCYKICGRITYYEDEEVCCAGTNCLIVDSEDLLYDDEVVPITMN